MKQIIDKEIDNVRLSYKMITKNAKNKTLVNKKTTKNSDSTMTREWLYLKKTALLRHYLGDIKTQGAHPANGQSKVTESKSD